MATDPSSPLAMSASNAFGPHNHSRCANTTIPISYSAVLEISRDKYDNFDTTKPDLICSVRLDCNMKKLVHQVPINNPSVVVTEKYVGSVTMCSERDQRRAGGCFLEGQQGLLNHGIL